MGLDSVELVIAIEEEFCIEMPISSECKTVGDVQNLVVEAVAPATPGQEDLIRMRVSEIVQEILGLKRNPSPQDRLVEDLGCD